MTYIDPKEGGAITAAFNWAQDHRCVSEYPSLDALLQATAQLAPTCDPSALRAYITEYAATEEVSIYVLAMAPPFDPLPAGAWRAGPITSLGQKGIVLMIICERDYFARLRGGTS